MTEPAQPSASGPAPRRDHDITVFGVTGFVGRLVAAHLAAHADPQLRIALAGRDRARVEAARDRLGEVAADWPIVIADAADGQSLREMAETTRVLITTVGPYARYGLPLVGACAAAGTDYVDLTGEVLFARASADAHHDQAVATGARIVHSCGFDSVPSDLSVHALAERAAADGAGGLTETTAVVTALRGGVSGGTIDSLRGQLITVRADAAARRLALDPYALSPDRAGEPDPGPQPDFALVPGSSVAPELRGRLAPFFMGPYNTRVVRRSNALTDWSYGRGLRYREAMALGPARPGPLVTALAGATAAGMGVLVAGLSFGPTRWLLDRVLPAPGAGPSRRTRERGHFCIDTFAATESGRRYRARFAAAGDPGYAATAVMLGEAALALASDGERLPDRAGVLTPATGIGAALTERLRTRGFTIEVRSR